jgi:thiol:disulfide interchange protein DsbC
MKKQLLGLTLLANTLLFANNEINKQEENINYELKFLNTVLPNTSISKYEPSEIDGFYKIYLANGNMFYVNPFKKLMIFGEIWTNNGFSITQNDRTKWHKELSGNSVKEINTKYKIEDITSIARKVSYGKGSSKYEFVLFTDPECPYCKIAEEYFEDNKNLDLHVIFTPLSFHKNAKDWSLKALSSKDIKQAMKDIKSNKIPNISISKKAEDELQKMQDLTLKLKVDGTPKILIIDKLENKIIDSIEGANIEAINKYQKENI